MGSNALTNESAITTNAAAWRTMEPTITVNSVTVSGKPVVKFTVTDGFDKRVTGLANATKASGATVASYPNFAFSLAKLVPGSNGGPSRWVSYMVTTVPSTATATAALTRPTTDNQGTLVDHGDGSYTYTFARDVTQVKAQVDAITTTGAANDKALLDDLTYNANLTHRVSVVLSGNAPGTGTNTPTGTASTVAAVPMANPVNVTYDFIPATGAKVTTANAQRDITLTAKCEACHQRLGGIPGLSDSAESAAFHSGARNNVAYCVVCHTDQRKWGRSEATPTSTAGAVRTYTGNVYVLDGKAMGNLPNFIHKVHLGHMNANVYNDDASGNGGYAGANPEHVHYSQDIRNCTTCHEASTATPQGDNWKAAPSRLACGSCHDGINFATGSGVTLADANAGRTQSTGGVLGGSAHPVMTDDSLCSQCHTAASIDVTHLPVTPPNAGSLLHVANGNGNTNSAWIASNQTRKPAGAITVSYEISSVAVNATTRRPSITFRTLLNGTVTSLNDFNAAASVNQVTGQKEILPNFMGAPSAYFVWAVPQDGIPTPSDYNASASGYLRSIWNQTATGTGAGTLVGPDANGYYTVTLTGVQVPPTATMVSGGIGYSYALNTTQPLTQTNLPAYPVTPSLNPAFPNLYKGGLIVVAKNAQRAATGFTSRRQIVEDAKCNACHQELGPFAEDAFHAGQRNDATTCAWCHTPNRANHGWVVDVAPMVHAMHAGAKRTVEFNYYQTTETSGNWSEIGYPGILSECEACHLPNTFDYSTAASQAALGNALPRTVAYGTYLSTGTYANGTAATPWRAAPYVSLDVNYGAAFSFNASNGTTTQATANTLITSPMATMCGSCHDSTEAITHFRANGGAWYEARGCGTGLAAATATSPCVPTAGAAATGALAKTETCLICHGPGRTAAIAAVHARR